MAETEYRNERTKRLAPRVATMASERGLKLTLIAGAVPTQAFGEIDGQRFYFRFRTDHASLRVGVMDATKAREAQEEYDRLAKGRIAHWEKRFQAGEMDEAEYQLLLLAERSPRFPEPNGVDDFPDITNFYASIPDVTGEPYAGELDDEQFLHLLSALIFLLEPLVDEGSAIE